MYARAFRFARRSRRENSPEMVISAPWEKNAIRGKKLPRGLQRCNWSRVESNRAETRARFDPSRDELAVKNSRETPAGYLYFTLTHYIISQRELQRRSNIRSRRKGRNTLVMPVSERYISIYQLSPGFSAFPNTFAKRHITSKLSSLLSFFFLFLPLCLSFSTPSRLQHTIDCHSRRIAEIKNLEVRRVYLLIYEHIMTVIDGIALCCGSVSCFAESRFVRISAQRNVNCRSDMTKSDHLPVDIITYYII